jgi:hypothetical protein
MKRESNYPLKAPFRRLARAGIYLALALPPAFALASGCGGGSGETGTLSSTGTSSGGAGTHSGGTESGGTQSGGGLGGSGGAGGLSGSTGTNSTGSVTGSTGSGGHPIAPCQGHVYECGDGIDNDKDGLIDSDDPDCLGPCDNTEGSYFGGIPGQNNAPCKMDCYFDQDTGPGNDDCYWDHKCDPHEVPPGYHPEAPNGSQCAYDPKANTPGTPKTCDELYAAQSDTCHAYCGPLTPNGCDCFGCCELPAGSKSFVWLGSVDGAGMGTCDIASLADPTKCQPCLPVAGCFNDCGHCELCIGKPTLPPDCYPPDGGSATGTGGAGGASTGATGGSTGSGGGQCDPGVQACGLPGQAPCPVNYYCVTGCCQKLPS